MPRFRWIGKSEDGETVVLHKFKGIFKSPAYATSEWLTANIDKIGTGVAIDIETTGLDKVNDVVIELGLRSFKFNRINGDILSVKAGYSELQDPGKPLSKEVKCLTGLNDTLLKDKTIDWSNVEKFLSEADIVIAHNASFDRSFIEKHVSVSKSKVWACSLKQINWTSKGFGIHKLEVLSIYHGFFTDSHRALADVDALLYLLYTLDVETGASYLNELLFNAKRPRVRIVATNSPFELKDLLKKRNYRWNQDKKVWHKSIYKDDVSSEILWLETTVYNGDFGGKTEEIPIVDNFKGME